MTRKKTKRRKTTKKRKFTKELERIFTQNMELFYEKDIKDLENARSYTDLVVVAKRIIRRIRKFRDNYHPGVKVIEICGPMSTGGFNDVVKNFKLFAGLIDELGKMYMVFNQLPFQKAMERLSKIKAKKGKAYNMDILTDFYAPIFRSELIEEYHFTPDWESSRGATFEMNAVKSLGSPILIIDEKVIKKVRKKLRI